MKVLVVDDSADMRRLTAYLLEANGCEVHTADGAHTALQVLHHYRPTVILLDVQMPEVSGFELLAQIRLDERLKTIPVIFYTAGLEPIDDEDARRLGAQGVLRKTRVGAAGMIEKLRSVVASQ